MHPDSAARTTQVELILEQVDALPTLSPVAVRLLSLGSAEEVEVEEIVRLIESDPALTAMVLGLCRRANTQLGDRIETVHHAVVMLGLDAVRSAVLGVCVYELVKDSGEEMDRLGRSPDPVEGLGNFDRVGLWKHSVAVACASELLAELAPELGVAGDEAFVAGLLHDLGKLVLELVLPRAMARVAAIAERRACDCATVERSVIGLDHHAAGRRIARRWGLPKPIADVMWLYSQPAESMPELPHRALIGVVSAAKAIATQQHMGWSGDFGTPASAEEAAADIGIEPDRVESILDQLNTEVVARWSVLRLDERTEPEMLLESIAGANRRLASFNSALQDRDRVARRRGRTLEAVTAFHAAWSPSRGVTETFESIAGSASATLGRGFYASVFQASDDEPWHVYQFGSEGRVVRSQAADPPDEGFARDASLASLTDVGGLSVASVGVLSWISDHLAEAPDLRTVRLMPLCVGGREGGPAAILLHDRDLNSVDLDAADIAALQSVWAAALRSATSSEQGRKFGERLAEASRMLAETQARFTQRESLARLGEMTAGAAHEMNNPLTVIRGRSQILAERTRADRDRADARAIAEAAEDLSDLITSLHLLADPPDPQPRWVHTRDLLEDAVKRGRARCGRAGSVRLRVEAEAERAFADPEQIAIAVGELVANGFEADPSGQLEIRAQFDQLENRLVIRATDSGPGFSAKAANHAFDPFFSEKPAGRQQGLGLSRARRLVESHGGEISLGRGPGGGGRVIVGLPAEHGREVTQESERTEAPVRRAG